MIQIPVTFLGATMPKTHNAVVPIFSATVVIVIIILLLLCVSNKISSSELLLASSIATFLSIIVALIFGFRYRGYDFKKLKKKLGTEVVNKFYQSRSQWLVQGISGNDTTFEKLHLYGVIQWREIPTQADRVIHWILTENGKKFIEYLDAHQPVSHKGGYQA